MIGVFNRVFLSGRRWIAEPRLVAGLLGHPAWFDAFDNAFAHILAADQPTLHRTKIICLQLRGMPEVTGVLQHSAELIRQKI